MTLYRLCIVTCLYYYVNVSVLYNICCITCLFILKFYTLFEWLIYSYLLLYLWNLLFVVITCIKNVLVADCYLLGLSRKKGNSM